MTIMQPPAANTQRPRVVKVSPVTVAAAQLRVTLDKRLGRTTSPVIAKIARARAC